MRLPHRVRPPHVGIGLARAVLVALPRRPSLSTVLRQGLLILGAALAYFAVRNLTEGSVSTALANARDIGDVETELGLDFEDVLQSWVVDREWLRTGTNWIYIWGHWPVIVVALVWLHLRHDAVFRVLRNAMFISGAIGLIIFAAYPVAPPRLAGIGAIDTVTMHSSSYRALQPPGLINRYAAMPSLHFGWNLLVGIALIRASSVRLVRLFAVLSPIAMAFAVVATANHFVLDVPAGGVVALIGLACVPVVDRALDAARSSMRRRR